MTHEPHDMDDAKLETVAERSMESAALILVSVLKDAGIRAIATGGFTAGFRAEAPGMVKVQTFEADAERARQVIAEIRELPEDAIASEDITTEAVREDPTEASTDANTDANTDASGPQA
jgi:hypothetical protein